MNAKAPWTVITATGTIDNGSTTGDQLQIVLPEAGECLVDNVQVLNPSAANLIANSTFETDASGWTAEGTESLSSLEATEGYNSVRSYHIRAVDRGDNQVNRVRTPLTAALSAGTTPVTISAAVRWLKGPHQILLRLRGNWLECAGEMALPVQPGTPGARNSRYIANAAPGILDVQHSPVLPQAGQSIIVKARVQDVDGIGSVFLKYRIDPSGTYTTLNMRDDGTGGDDIANDGVFAATIPGQSSGAMIAFYIQANDAIVPPAAKIFPSDAPARDVWCAWARSNPAGIFPCIASG